MTAADIAPCELLNNILNQPASIQAVTEHQFGSGNKALQAAAECVKKNGEIILSGMGSSLFACVPLAYRLTAGGIPATTIEAAELLHSGARLCRPGSVVLLASRSGETVEVVKLLPILKTQGVTTIGVTNVPDSPLAREATYPVLVNSCADQLVAVQTYVGTLITLLLLGAWISGEPQARWKADLDTLVGALSSYIPQCIRASADWRKFLDLPGATYVLGRGPSLGSVSEGALLFHETARAPAVGMSAAHFRHGPVEVVNQQFRAFVFATHSATQALDVALATDIKAIGGTARLIGPSCMHADFEPCRWPEATPEVLAPALEIVPIQIAALRLAQWRGVPAGQFRFATPVTLAETGFGEESLSQSSTSRDSA